MKDHQYRNIEMLKKTSKELGFSVYEIAKVEESIKRHLKKLLDEKSYRGIQLPYFGKIYAKPERVWAMNNKPLYKMYVDTGVTLKQLRDELKQRMKDEFNNSRRTGKDEPEQSSVPSQGV
jgi:hypothetical protein